MNVPITVASFAFGCVFIAIAIVGGGVSIRDLTIPQMSIASRTLAIVFGGLLMVGPVVNPALLARIGQTPEPPKPVAAGNHITPAATEEPLNAPAQKVPSAPAPAPTVTFTISDELGKTQFFERVIVTLNDKFAADLMVVDEQKNDTEVVTAESVELTYRMYSSDVIQDDKGVWVKLHHLSGEGKITPKQGDKYSVSQINVDGKQALNLVKND